MQKTFLERGMVFPGSTQFYDVEVKKYVVIAISILVMLIFQLRQF